MSIRRCLGNDVVDLGHPRLAGSRTRQDRFVARVLAPEEKRALAEEDDPQTALWLYWAAKETVFKSVSKALGRPPPFRHSLFRVRLEPPPDPGGNQPLLGPRIRKGRGSYGEFQVNLRIEAGPGWIHALGWMGDPTKDLPWGVRYGVAPIVSPPGEWKEALRSLFSPREWQGVYQPASALARLEARGALAAALGVEEGRLEIAAGPGAAGRRIPRVLLDGVAAPLDLTLSHHGNWIGWAFLWGEEPRDRGPVSVPPISPTAGT